MANISNISYFILPIQVQFYYAAYNAGIPALRTIKANKHYFLNSENIVKLYNNI